MTAFDREYRELDRLKGMSLKDDVLLYKITPERTEQEMVDLWWASHIRAHEPEPTKKPWTWKTMGVLLLGFGLAVWLWYEALN